MKPTEIREVRSGNLTPEKLSDNSRHSREKFMGSRTFLEDANRMKEKSGYPTKSNSDKAVVRSSTLQDLDDQMNYEHLKKLEKIFQDAKTEGSRGLSMEQFRVAMKRTMGDTVNDRQLDLMFMKVDNDCDGTVDWNEYLTYMLLEYQEKDNMLTSDQIAPFAYPMVEKSSSHTEPISRIAMLQVASSQSANCTSSDVGDAAGRYLTLSKEGAFNIWNLDWRLQKSINLKEHSKSIYYTDMVCMANCNSFVVSASDFVITFYSVASNLVQKKFQIKDLHCCALTLEYSYDEEDSQKAILLWGDTAGSIFILRFYKNPSIALFSNTNFHGAKCSLDRLLKYHSQHFHLFKLSDVHRDWVQQVRYFSSKNGQECFLSCSMCDESALVYADITENRTHTKSINRKSYFSIRKGVTCVTYDSDWNLIVTGSVDSHVRVWNPFIVRRSLAVLKGHHSSVTQVLLRRVDRQAISISKDSNIRVWDLRFYTCKQSINGRYVRFGRLEISSSYFNEKRRELIIGSTRIGIFYPQNRPCNSHVQRIHASHQKPVTCVLYNKLFHQIVTGGEDSMVCIWDVNTSKKTMQFCAEKGVEITSMAFDPSWRRLATGLRNGSTKVWNFNNGACLRRISNDDNLEISSIVFCKQRIITAGWAKTPMVHIDSYTDEDYFAMNHQHNDDIMTMDYHKGDSILASAAYDGDIFIWPLGAREETVSLNIHKSLLPMYFGNGKKGVLQSGIDPMDPTNGVHYIDTWMLREMPWRRTRYDKRGTFTTRLNKINIQNRSLLKIADRSVYKVIFLQTRKISDSSATLLASYAKGWITAWSVHACGGLLGYFMGTSQNDEMVIAMDTDSSDSVLITGDSRGCIRVWNIDGYCDSDAVANHRECQKEDNKKSNFSTTKRILRARFLPISTSPELKCSFRGHTNAVTSIAFIELHHLIASGGVDGSIRLWTLCGRYIGTFGQMNSWNIQFPIEVITLKNRKQKLITGVDIPNFSNQDIDGVFYSVNNSLTANHVVIAVFVDYQQSELPMLIPEDIQRVASEATLRTIGGGNREESDDSNTHESSEPIWTDEKPQSLNEEKLSSYEDEDYLVVDQESKLTSSILGKLNYKPKKRHREFKSLKKIRWFSEHASVYNALNLVQLESIDKQPHLPDFIKKSSNLLFKQQSQDCTNFAVTTVSRHAKPHPRKTFKGARRNVRDPLKADLTVSTEPKSRELLPTLKQKNKSGILRTEAYNSHALPAITVTTSHTINQDPVNDKFPISLPRVIT